MWMLSKSTKTSITSGSYDEVKVWNVDTGICLRTLRMIRVASLQIHGAIVITGGVWDVFAGMCLRTMREHVPGDVIHLQFDGRLVVSGIEWPECPINVWDPQTGECLRTLDQKNFNCFRLHGCHLLVMLPGITGSIKVWDVDTGVCRHTFEGIHARYLKGIHAGYMALLSDRLVSRSGTGAKIWSLSTGACLITLAGLQKHNRSINGIQVNEKFVVTSSWDGKVMLSDVKTGDFIRYLFVMEPGETVVKMEMEDGKIVFFVQVRAHGRREAHRTSNIKLRY